MTERRAKIVRYETKVCTRCNGSGSHSFNLRDGTRCWKCWGNGTQLSANGKRALKRISAWKAEHLTRTGETLQTGDLIRPHSSRAWRKVCEVRESDGRVFAVVHEKEFQNGEWAVGIGDGIQIKAQGESFQALAKFAARYKGAIIEYHDDASEG